MSDADRIAVYRRSVLNAARSSREGRAVSVRAEQEPFSLGMRVEKRGARPGFNPPSWKQWRKLAFELGGASDSECDGFARFANGYHHGPLQSVHLVHAISLAMHGVNQWGTAEQLVELSSDPLAELTGNGLRAFKGRGQRPSRKRPKP